MLKYIQKKSLLKSINKTRSHCFKSFQEIHSVALFFEIKQLNEVIEITKQLQGEEKTVALYTVFSSKKMKQTLTIQKALPQNCKIIDPKEFSWLGQLNTTSKKQIAEANYDMTIDLSDDDILIQHLFLANPCNFRVGIHASNYSLYDFCILKKEDQKLSDVFSEIKKYLNCIRKA